MMALIQNGALCLMSRWRMQQKLLPACMGRRTQLAKVDIKSAYQIVLFHPEERLLLGLQWENKLFIDAVLLFGLKSAPKIFSAVAEVLKWHARFDGLPHVFALSIWFPDHLPSRVTKRRSGP